MKTAFITGGASGIGKAVAMQLARRGIRVIIADRQIQLASETCDTIQKNGGEARAVALDVRDYTAFRDAINEVLDHEGRLDYLFNNAGIGTGGYFGDMTTEDWNSLIDVNLYGVINGCRAAYPIMAKQGFGHIVNTASAAGLMPSLLASGYSATKHAVVGLSLSLRIEGTFDGVKVSVLCPGLVSTPIIDDGGRYGSHIGKAKPIMRHVLTSLRPVTSELFARKALSRIDRNKGIIVVPGYWRVIWWFSRLFPEGMVRMMMATMRKSLKELDTGKPAN